MESVSTYAEVEGWAAICRCVELDAFSRLACFVDLIRGALGRSIAGPVGLAWRSGAGGEERFSGPSRGGDTNIRSASGEVIHAGVTSFTAALGHPFFSGCRLHVLHTLRSAAGYRAVIGSLLIGTPRYSLLPFFLFWAALPQGLSPPMSFF